MTDSTAKTPRQQRTAEHAAQLAADPRFAGWLGLPRRAKILEPHQIVGTEIGRAMVGGTYKPEPCSPRCRPGSPCMVSPDGFCEVIDHSDAATGAAA